jgi:tungstate transport system ATP-binding protein
VKQFELEKLVFRRGPRFTLDIDEFVLERGERVAVVGPNGSGKTALLRILSFLEHPDSWTRFLFRGQPYAAGKMARTGLGLLKQEPLLFRGSVAENLAYPLKLRSLPSSEIRSRVEGMLARMELEPLADARAGHLSVGEQRRVALGRILIAGNGTLLLDEPIAHLDARSSGVIEDVLMKAEETILLTTHDVHFAHRVAGRVLSIRAGRMSEGLSVNILQGQVQEGRLVTGHGLRILLPDTTVSTRHGSLTVALDPRRLVISVSPPAEDSRNRLRGRVSSVREQGEDVWVEIDCGHRLTAILGRSTYEEGGLNLHREVFVSFDPDAVEVV